MKKLLPLLGLLAIFLLVTPAGAADPPGVDVSALKVPAGAEQVAISHELASAKGPVQVWVRLADDPLTVAVGDNAKVTGAPRLSAPQQQAYVSQLGQKQNALSASVRSMGGKELARVTKVLNAVAYRVDASKINDLAKLPGVRSVQIVRDFQLDYETDGFVKYIGAATAQAKGVDGTGVRVAVLDTGVDYTHAFFGGPGTLEAYHAAYGNTITDTLSTTTDGLFPTAKVVGGYDFVGPNWPVDSDVLQPDPDPIPCSPEVFSGCDGTHGTHVADIIAGRSNDGTHVGVAPGAKLYAYTVCSQRVNSCSGVAMIEGLDAAVDPNGDGNVSDAVDVVNMSIGSPYGQLQDDSVLATENAVKFGVTVVTSAGNSSDRPFIVGSPSIAPSAISVAASFDVQAKLYPITSGSVSVGGLWLAWSRPPVTQSAVLAYDTASSATKLGCMVDNPSIPTYKSPWTGTPLAGKIVLVDRGTCAISLKAAFIAAAGGIAAVIANNASQPPVDLPPGFSYGGGDVTIPAYSIMKTDGTSLKGVAGEVVTIDADHPASLVENLASYSSRGPSYDLGTIKPDITALADGIMAARAGTGTGWTAFNGTSAAAPTTAGSAALVVQAHPKYAPFQVKAALMNTAETNLYLNSFKAPTYLAPISRIGAGEVRVDRAVDAKSLAWGKDDRTASLSFGYQVVPGTTTLQKTVVVQNNSNTTQTYKIAKNFRYANDAASGAVTLSFLASGGGTLVVPNTLTVPPGSSREFVVKMTINTTKLPFWSNVWGPVGMTGGDGYRLQDVEFDGLITLTSGNGTIHLPWHVLPHRASVVNVNTHLLDLPPSGSSSVLFTNAGKLKAEADVFALTGTSPQMPAAALPGIGANEEVADLRAAGVRLADPNTVQFGVSLYGKLAHPAYPIEVDILVDTNNDGVWDHVAWTQENGSFATSGQTIVYAGPNAKGKYTASYYLDADLESGNRILTVPLANLGLTNTSQFKYSVVVYDNYFTGNATDSIGWMTYKFDQPHYAPGALWFSVPVGGTYKLTVNTVPGGTTASPSQKGFLILYRDGRVNREAELINVIP